MFVAFVKFSKTLNLDPKIQQPKTTKTQTVIFGSIPMHTKFSTVYTAVPRASQGSQIKRQVARYPVQHTVPRVQKTGYLEALRK